MKLWEMAAAAAAMMAGAGEAQAVTWVQYTVTGNGTAATGFMGTQNGNLATFTAVLTVNTDQGSGTEGGVVYATTGNSYTAQSTSSGALQIDNATFFPASIIGRSTVRGAGVFQNLGVDSGGGVAFAQTVGQSYAYVNGTATGLRIATVAGPSAFSFSYVLGAATAPEPATWGLMLAGFGMVGGALRRRRSLRVAYAG